MASPATQLFRVYKTVIEMLRDRMYLVTKTEENMTKELFFEKFDLSDDEVEIPRDKFAFFKRSKKDPTDRIFVFFPNEHKVGIKTMAKYFVMMENESINRAILVIPQDLTPHAKGVLAQDTARKIEYFKESELLVNITKHVLVPRHYLLSPEEKSELLKRYKMKDSQLPCIQRNDPVAKYYGLQRGEVVKIVRNSETAGKYVTYRLVI